jgi:hypothetical protein
VGQLPDDPRLRSQPLGLEFRRVSPSLTQSLDPSAGPLADGARPFDPLNYPESPAPGHRCPGMVLYLISATDQRSAKKLYNLILKRKKSIHPTFRYPMEILKKNKNNHRQGVGILFRSVIFSMLLTKNIKPVLCYEVFKKWPLLSLFPGCIRKKLPLFHLTIILEP